MLEVNHKQVEIWSQLFSPSNMEGSFIGLTKKKIGGDYKEVKLFLVADDVMWEKKFGCN